MCLILWVKNYSSHLLEQLHISPDREICGWRTPKCSVLGLFCAVKLDLTYIYHNRAFKVSELIKESFTISPVSFHGQSGDYHTILDISHA